ncbi:MAG: enoyl-CoA hydratase/isomerase family protein [Chloroflexi bacterium]|nr:enoyl-CoA hydratase/isomerase family protein [Chloroflexota bacterium]
MTYKYVLYEKTGNIARLTFNKPDKMNAYTFVGRGEDAQEVFAALKEAADDDDVKVVIIKGSGRAFNVGNDLTKVGFVYGMGTRKDERRPSQRIRLKIDSEGLYQDALKILYHPKITISQIHGYCLGWGPVTALQCDLAIAAEDAKIGFTEQRLGFAGVSRAFIMLINAVGLKRARELLLTGRMISGKEAAEIGLVNKAVPADKLEEEVEKSAQAMCLLPRDGIAIGKAITHLTYEQMGFTSGLVAGYIGHTLFTNLRWESDEYNFFRERRDKGARQGFHGRDERYKGLVE